MRHTQCHFPRKKTIQISVYCLGRWNSFPGIVRDAIVLSLVVMLSKLGARSLHLVLVASAPRHPASLAAIQLLVILDHVFVYLSPLPVNILILLIELIAILVALVVQLVDGLRVVPVFVGLAAVFVSVSGTIVQVILLLAATALVSEPTRHRLALPVEIIDARYGIRGMLLVLHRVREVMQCCLLLPDLRIKRIYLAIDLVHSVVVYVPPRIVVGMIERTIGTLVKQILHTLIRKPVPLTILKHLPLLLFHPVLVRLLH